MKERRRTIFILEAEEDGCNGAATVLKRSGFRVHCFTDAGECLERLQDNECHLLITDMKTPRAQGLAMLSRVKHVAPWTPVMVVTDEGDIPTAVSAMKLGAVDFMKKPLDSSVFLQSVEIIVRRDGLENGGTGKPLTRTEKKVLKLTLEGKANKEIAHILGRTTRTVEFHRANIKQKFGVDTLVDLVKKAASLDLTEAD